MELINGCKYQVMYTGWPYVAVYEQGGSCGEGEGFRVSSIDLFIPLHHVVSVESL